MRAFFIIFFTSLRQAFRRKFLAGLLLTCFVALCVSLAFSQLSLDDKGRLTVDFGLASIQLLLVALSIFFGSSFISEDLDKKTLWMILSRPIRPAIFFLARYIALSVLLLLTLISLSLMILTFFVFLNIPIEGVLFYALFGFLMESLLILAFVLFFSSFVSSYLVLFYGFSVFLIGHFLESLQEMIKDSTGVFHLVLSKVIDFLPNLEAVNWKSEVLYQDSISFMDFSSSVFYIFLWIGFVLSGALILMENKEL